MKGVTIHLIMQNNMWQLALTICVVIVTSAILLSIPWIKDKIKQFTL